MEVTSSGEDEETVLSRIHWKIFQQQLERSMDSMHCRHTSCAHLVKETCFTCVKTENCDSGIEQMSDSDN